MNIAPPQRRLFEVLHEDDELLVVNKPAGLVCHPTKGDEWSSLISRARLHVGPAAAPPHLVNRLDRETSGVVMLAKTVEAAVSLRRVWENRSVRKGYLAIVHGTVRERDGWIDAPLGPDVWSEISIKDRVRPDGAAASTRFLLERHLHWKGWNFSLLRVFPETGRKHQIRIHLSHLGHPIVGDKLYGGDERLYLDFVKDRLSEGQRRQLIFPHHALHAETLDFGWRDSSWSFRAPPEGWFVDFVEGGVVREWPAGEAASGAAGD